MKPGLNLSLFLFLGMISNLRADYGNPLNFGQADWRPCSLMSEGGKKEAECSFVTVPLDWHRPDGREIRIFLKRYLGKGSKKKQVWIIQGGPGSSGANDEPLVEDWSSKDPNIDFYLPDHRGTGRSERLACPQTEGTTYNFLNQLPATLWPKCLEEIFLHWKKEDLQQFSITNAARDLVKLIEVSKVPGQKVSVIGTSYGTNVVQRYLQLAPDQADSIILDGFTIPGIGNIIDWDENHDLVGKKILQLCKRGPFCANRLGGDPMVFYGRLLQKMQGTGENCAGISRDGIRAMLALFADNAQYRNLIPAIIYRLDRCNGKDLQALAFLRKKFSGLLSPRAKVTAALSSQVLQNIIVSSELLTLPLPTVSELQKKQEEYFFSAGLSLNILQIKAKGFSYAHDQFYGRFPARTPPLLMLNGTLDASTPIEQAREIARGYKSRHQHFISLPLVGHTPLHQSPTLDPRTPSCGLKMAQLFIKNPRSQPDRSCLKKLVPLDFKGNQAEAMAYFGRPDFWD